MSAISACKWEGRKTSKTESRHFPCYCKTSKTEPTFSLLLYKCTDGSCNIDMPSCQYRMPIITIRRSQSRFICIMGITFPGKTVFILRQGLKRHRYFIKCTAKSEWWLQNAGYRYCLSQSFLFVMTLTHHTKCFNHKSNLWYRNVCTKQWSPSPPYPLLSYIFNKTQLRIRTPYCHYSLSGKTFYRLNSWSEIGCYKDRIAMKFDRHLGSAVCLSNFKTIEKV